MNCPNCGKELKEGKLYCEYCGQEIQMVPDFEPEIEITIEESLLNVAESISEPSMASTRIMEPIFVKQQKESALLDKEFVADEFEEEDLTYTDEILPDDDFWDVNEAIDFSKGAMTWHKFLTLWKKKVGVRIGVGFLVFMLCVGIVFLAIFITKTVRNNSYEYQYTQAMTYSGSGDYATAVEFMERAVFLDSTNTQAKLTLADLYNKNGETENAILVLKEVIAYNDDNVLTAYTQLFQIYTEIGSYDLINQTLVACEDPKIRESFQEYLALPPEFGIEEGTYNEVQHLKMTANTKGTIYYTIDGTQPSMESSIYTSPIYLESGAITVSAYFVNENGMSSDVVTKKYVIDVLVPDAPIVMPESGEYTLPNMLMVSAPEGCKVYYTMDQSEPTIDSDEFVEPICMPLGTTNFAFVAIGEDNIPSEIVKRQFTLNMETKVTAAEAANLVTNYRFSLGGLTDTDGHLVTVAGRLLYLCKGAVAIDGAAYYFVGEYYEDPVTLSQIKTGLQYGVNVMDGQVVSMEMDDYGYYYIIEAVTEPTVTVQ